MKLLPIHREFQPVQVLQMVQNERGPFNSLNKHCASCNSCSQLKTIINAPVTFVQCSLPIKPSRHQFLRNRESGHSQRRSSYSVLFHVLVKKKLLKIISLFINGPRLLHCMSDCCLYVMQSYRADTSQTPTIFQ